MVVARLVQQVYNRALRERLPRKPGIYAGVPARTCKLFDATDHFPDYKRGVVEAIQEHVSEGDHVELVGFGRGISTVHILRAGAEHVTAHEAAPEMIEIGRETLTLNAVPEDAVDVRHSLVGEAVDVYGDESGATVVSPSELSSADVLLLDCEGAEESILAALGESPPTVIVETHPERGVPPQATIDALDDDYEIERRQYHPEREPEKQVIVGTRS